MADTLNIYGVTYSGVTGIKATDSNNNVLTYVRPTGTKSITENGTGIDVSAYATADVNVGGGTLETITKTYTPTTSQQTEQITPSSGYDGIAEVDVTVNAMPTGTEGTPTATKGAVSNHSVSVTPSVTNVAGYIEGGTKTGTAVTVSASELDSGTKSITANGNNQDVVGYAAVDVAVPNSYSAADEGKVVSSGALVAQTAHADVTPTTSDQTIDTTTNNSIKVKGDANLVAGNIKKDVVIFNTTGTYEGGGGGDEYIDNTFDVIQVLNSSKLDTMVFRRNTRLKSISMPNAVYIITEAFYQCSNLEAISFPKAEYVYGNAFYQCDKIVNPIAFPKLKDLTNSCFAQLTKVPAIDIGGTGNINIQAFLNCNSMDYLVLRSNTVKSLGNVNAFQQTKFASGGAGGTLYVPASLVSSYQSASNWSTLLGYANNQIKSIESTHTDPNAPIDLTLYYADGTLIPT